MSSSVPIRAAEPPTGEPRGEWSLRPEAQSARLARRLVAQALQGADEHLRRRAALITSELVGNGVRHARGGMLLSVWRVPAGWVLAVADDSHAPPVVKSVGQLTEDGRGLFIVQRISERLGWARTATGKVVWACLGDSAAR